MVRVLGPARGRVWAGDAGALQREVGGLQAEAGLWAGLVCPSVLARDGQAEVPECSGQIGRASCRERVETVAEFIFRGFKITADGDCSHEIKRHLLLGRKVMTN